MSDFIIIQPFDTDELTAALAGATRRIDSPTQRRIFGAEHQTRSVEERGRRPEWAWRAVATSGDVLGFIAAWGPHEGPFPWIIDFHDVRPDRVDVGAALYRRAIEDLRRWGMPEPVELIVFTPADDDPPSVGGVPPIIEAAAGAGYEILVVRRRFELDTETSLPARLATELRFDPIAGSGDERLVPTMAAILDGSLDAHHVRDLARMSVADVAVAETSLILDVEGAEAVHVVVDPDGVSVGLAVAGSWGNGRGAVAFVGVVAEHRGKGYGAQITSATLHTLADNGVRTVVGETDVPNAPMTNAFIGAGFEQTESRIDLVNVD